jgi:O-antigen/teichoic acid export membrane protein
VLVLQLAAYINYLNFGVQTAIGRYVSQAIGTGNQHSAERILTAGAQILTLLAVLGFVVLAGLAWSFPLIFRQVDPKLVPVAQSALLWVGSALAIGLPFSAFLGVFIGLQRNDIAAAIAMVGKLLLAILLIVTAATSRNLETVSKVYFFGSILIYAAQYLVFVTVCRDWTLRIIHRVKPEVRELAFFCASLTVWFLAMFLINGIDTTIVGFFKFRMVAAYGAAISIVGFFSGAIQALMAPLVQIFAKLDAQAETDKLVDLVYKSSFGCTLFLLTSAAVLISLSNPLFVFWVGPEIAKDAVPLFNILIVANALRCSAVPYANYLVATGQQRRVMLGPAAEGLTNLGISLAGAYFIGALGVALGTLAGALVGVSVNYFYNFGRTMPPIATIRRMAKANFLQPLFLTAPLIAVAGAQMAKLLPYNAAFGAIALACVPPAIIGYRQLRATS